MRRAHRGPGGVGFRVFRKTQACCKVITIFMDLAWGAKFGGINIIEKQSRVQTLLFFARIVLVRLFPGSTVAELLRAGRSHQSFLLLLLPCPTAHHCPHSFALSLVLRPVLKKLLF